MQKSSLLLWTFVVASCCLIDTVTSARILRPDCSDQPNGIFLPDPRSCARYFVCINGHALARRCRIGYAYDMDTYQCDLAPLVDCDLKKRQPDIIQPATVTQSPAPCTTTTCAPPATPCATTPCPPPVTPCSTTPCPPPVTPCSTTPSPPAVTPCSTTPSPPPVTPCSTTPCPPAATPCSTTPCPPPVTPCSKTPCPQPVTPCSTTSCPTTTKVPTPEIHYKRRNSDCQNYDDGTILLDRKHCRTYYTCKDHKAQRIRCIVGQWYDYEIGICRDRTFVTNCLANHS